MHLIVVTYDIDGTTTVGQKRQRKIAKLCESYGSRVQNSVFECFIDAAQSRQLRTELLSLINEERDQIKLYRLGKNYVSKVDTLGKPTKLDFNEPFIF